jgi:hypothetical protein
MKRTLDQLLQGFQEQEVAEREAAIAKILDEIIRPHVLNLDNWRIDDLHCVSCETILFPSGTSHWITYAAWQRMKLELTEASNRSKDYQPSSSGGDGWLNPTIIQNPSARSRLGRRRLCADSAEFIYQKTWERCGPDFKGILSHEVDRLVTFLGDPDNWIPKEHTSKLFEWSEPLRYTRYDAHDEVKRLVLLKLETDQLTLTFRGPASMRPGIQAKIVRKDELNEDSL